MIPKEIGRFYRILQVFLNYGIDELLPKKRATLPLRILRRGFFWIKNKHPQEPLGVRLRLVLEQLGPVWIKFGQMLSTRPDILPIEVTHQLALLQDAVPPFDGKQAKYQIEAALGGRLENWFDDFDEKPLASASIAQVHTATLREKSQAIVIKVIRPDILPIIQADIRLIYRLAKWAEKFLPDARRLRPIAVVADYEKTLMDELNLSHEAANAIQLGRNFEHSPLLYIPKVYSDYSRQSVMVMERIYGIPVSNINALKQQGVDLQSLAERGVQVFFTQVFRDSFFHADMHPGNVFVSYSHPETPQYIAIDCGIVGTLNKEDKRYLAENFIAFFNRNYRKVAELHVDSGWVPADTCVEDFESAIRTLCEPVFQKPLAEISFGHLLINLFTTAQRFNMEVQPQLVLLQKTLLYVEGLGRQLYPQLDLWKTAKPFLEKWIKEQTGIRALVHNLKNNAPYWVEQLPEIPNLFYDNLRQQRALKESVDRLTHSMSTQLNHHQRARYLSGISTVIFVSSFIALILRHDLLVFALVGVFISLILWIAGWTKII